MFFFTHLKISKMIYGHLGTEMCLDKKAFMYGNIKPDLTPDLMNCPHTYANYFDIMCGHIEKIVNDRLDIYNFSVELGQICHYICDFFCLYHLDERIWSKKKDHFLYEVSLHIKLLLNKSKLRNNHKVSYFENDIATYIKNLRKEYESMKSSKMNDLEYSISAIVSVCDKLYLYSPKPITESSIA